MVEIFGGDYSLTIVIPFILIVAIMLFFLTTFIKDNIGKLRLKIRKKKKKEEKKEPINFSKEYLNLKKHISSLNTADSLDSMTEVIKKYIAEKLNIQTEFSFEELPRNKIDWPVIEFTKRLSDLKYSGREVTKAEISHLMLYLSKIMKVKTFHDVKENSGGIIPRLIKFPKIEFKFPKLMHKIHHEKHIEEKPEKRIKPIDFGLPKKIKLDFTWLFKKKDEKLKEIKHEKIEAPKNIKLKTPEPEHKKIRHHHKPSIFERIRLRYQSGKILKLIKKADKKSQNNPLLSRKLYNEALITYYKLPVEKEENIAIKLDKYYQSVNGNHERELINVKHNSRKETREALKHLKKYRNYLIIENNSFNNKLRKSIDEVKRSSVVHMGRTKDKKVKSELLDFLRIISKEEANLFELEEKSIKNLLRNAFSLLKNISKDESKEAYDEYVAIKKLFSHLKIDHKLPKAPMPIIKHEDLKNEIKLITEIKPEFNIDNFIKKPVEEKPIIIKPPKIDLISKKKVISISPPIFPEKRISERMKKLMEEKESVYNKLKEVEGKELDRFKQTKRMTIHEDMGYRDYLANLKPRQELKEEHRLKKIFEAK